MATSVYIISHYPDKRILCGFVVLMIILAGVATGFLYIKLNTNATTGNTTIATLDPVNFTVTLISLFLR